MNGICEWVIGILHDHDTWFYCGKTDKRSKMPCASSYLADAKRYDDMELLRDDLEGLREWAATLKIIEIQKCPKCHKEFVDYPAISREDNETEICPECGVREAINAYTEAQRSK